MAEPMRPERPALCRYSVALGGGDTLYTWLHGQGCGRRASRASEHGPTRRSRGVAQQQGAGRQQQHAQQHAQRAQAPAHAPRPPHTSRAPHLTAGRSRPRAAAGVASSSVVLLSRNECRALIGSVPSGSSTAAVQVGRGQACVPANEEYLSGNSPAPSKTALQSRSKCRVLAGAVPTGSGTTLARASGWCWHIAGPACSRREPGRPLVFSP